MANKKNRKKAQQADQQAASTTSAGAGKKAVSKKAEVKKTESKKATAAKKDDKKAAKKKKDKGPGLFARIRKYFASVRSEMRRCVWPTKKELLNYSVVVCVSLVVVGVCIALIDGVISQGLVLFAGLRG